MVPKIITSRSFLLNYLSKENIQHTMYATKHNHLKYLQSQNKNTSQYPNNFGHFPKQAKERYPLASRSVCLWKKLKKKRTLLKTVLNVLVHKMNQFLFVVATQLFVGFLQLLRFFARFLSQSTKEHFSRLLAVEEKQWSVMMMMAIKN